MNMYLVCSLVGNACDSAQNESDVASVAQEVLQSAVPAVRADPAAVVILLLVRVCIWHYTCCEYGSGLLLIVCYDTDYAT